MRFGISREYSLRRSKRLLSLSMPRVSAVRLKAITSMSENRGTTPRRGVFPCSLAKSLENFLVISKVLTKFVYGDSVVTV